MGATIWLSTAVHAEIAEVFARPKFARMIDAERTRNFLAMIHSSARWTEPDEVVVDCRDAKDDKYLELALAAQADVIVSSDSDLLVMDPWRGIRILTPAQFVA